MQFITQFVKPYWKLVLGATLCIFIDVAGALYIPTLASKMLHSDSLSQGMTALWSIAIQMILATLVSGIAALVGSYICADLAGRIGKDMRDAIYKKTLKLSISDFKEFGTASVTTRTITDISNIQMALTNFIQMALPVPIIFLLATYMTFQLDAVFGWILLSIVALVMVVAYVIMKIATPLFQRLQVLLDKMSTILLENITGVRVVRAFRRERDEEARINAVFSDYATTSIKANKKFATLDGLSVLMINVFVILVYWLTGFRATLGSFQIADVNSVINYAIFLLTYLMMAQMIILTLPRALECWHRIQAILNHSSEIVDKISESVSATDDAPVVEFRQASFQFPDAEEGTLHNLSFSIEKGKTTAIIGGTGSGKSTIAAMILRFHDTTGGSIRLYGQDLRRMTQESLREKISYVQQKAWLFSGTIAENLRFGNEDASDEDLYRALEIAQAKEFVENLPEKLDAYVAKGGTNFSGGQRQRLAIARALVKKAGLYIFDDSFSALDFRTDAALRKALNQEMSDVALLIIAQRVSTIRQAEQIIVLDEGQVVGIGKHNELMQTCPVYQEIVKSQTREEED